MGPDDLPQPMLTTHHKELPEPLAAAASDPLALADAVAALRRYSLVRVVAEGLFVHRLLQTVVLATLDDDAKCTWTSVAVRLLQADFPYKSDKVDNWSECQRLLPHVLAVAEHGQRLEVEFKACLRLLNRAAVYLQRRGQYRQSLPLFEQILAGRRRLLGDDHPATLTSMNNLAVSRRNVGDLEGAQELHGQTLAARRRVLGEDHPATLTSMRYLTAFQQELGEL